MRKNRSPLQAQAASPVLLHVPGYTFGPLVPDDAGTVSHVTWNGSALVDSKGNAWTMSGTVPQVTSSLLFPGGYAGPSRAGAGPFSNANYYKLGSGSDVLDFAGDWTGVVVWAQTAANTVPLFEDGNTSNQGYRLQIQGGTAPLFIYDGAAGNPNVTNAGSVADNNGVNVTCCGRSGNTIMLQTNGSALASAAITPPYTPGSGSGFTLGTGAGLTPSGTFIYEAWFSTSTPSAAAFTSIIGHVFQQVGTQSEPVTNARVSASSYDTAAGVGYAYTKKTAVTNLGLQTCPAGTNLLFPSNNFASSSFNKFAGGAGVVPVVTVNAAVAPDGTTTAALITFDRGSPDTSDNYSLVDGPSLTTTATPYACSTWVRTSDGTSKTFQMGPSSGDPNLAVLQASGAWTRFTSSFVMTAGNNNIFRIGLRGGHGDSQSASLHVWGVQFENNGYASPYIPTTTNSASRDADAVSFQNPLSPDDTAWCVEGVWTPLGGKSWVPNSTENAYLLWSVGTVPTAWAYIYNDGRFFLETFDAAAAEYQVNLAAGIVNGFAAGSSHRLSFVRRSSGPDPILEIWLDGVKQAVTNAVHNVSTPSLAAATFNMKAAAWTTAVVFPGTVRDFKVGRTDDPSRM